MRRSRLSLLTLIAAAATACTTADPSPGSEVVSSSEAGAGGRLFAHLPRGSRVGIEGSLEVYHVDNFDMSEHHEIYYVRESGTDRRIEVKLGDVARGSATPLATGAKVRVHGRLAGDDDDSLEVEAAADLEVLEPAESPLASGGAFADIPATMRRVATIRVNFTDMQVYCTDADVTALMYTDVLNIDGWYREVSYGNLGFDPDTNADGTPDVFSVNINATTTEGCNPGGWAEMADRALNASGVDLSIYQHKLYVLPGWAQCNWAGLAVVGCYGSCQAWVRTCATRDVYAHELGHNLMFHHAASDTNNDGVIDNEYGDRSDLMGWSGVGYRHTNAPHKIQAGWVPAEKIAQPSGVAETFRIAPLEARPETTPNLQVLRLPKSDTESYFVSYRRAIGSYSANLNWYADQISIHRHRGGSIQTALIAVLGDGASWSDPTTGLTITQTGHDELTASVDVRMVCIPNTPVVTFEKPSVGRIGGVYSQRVTVQNRDGRVCPAATFAISGSSADGWDVRPSVATLTVAPGSSASFDLSVTVPDGLADGAYALAVSATDVLDPAHAGSASGSHIVDTTPPSPVTNLGAGVNKTKVTLSWLASTDGAGAGVARYHVMRDGVRVATVSTTTYTETVSGGRYSYTVTAEDNVGNVSAPGTTATVSVKGGGRNR